MCVITRECLVVNPEIQAVDLVEMVKVAAARAGLPYTTETVWSAIEAIGQAHGLRPRLPSPAPPFRRLAVRQRPRQR